MRTWWKRWGLVAAGLLGVGEGLALRAQEPAGIPAGPQVGAPAGYPGLDPQYCPPPGGPPQGPPGAPPLPSGPNAFWDEEPCERRPDPYCLWLRGEYLTWRVKHGRFAAPLVTTSTTGGTGALGEAGTQSLVGEEYGYSLTNGGRVVLGLMTEYCPPVELTGYWINNDETLFTGGSTDGTGLFLARPVVRADLAGSPQGAALVNAAGTTAGQIDVTSRINLWNFEGNVFCPICDADAVTMAVIVGYRHTDLTEEVDIRTTLGPGASLNFAGNLGFPTGFAALVRDSFKTRSQFDGGTLGLRSTLYVWKLAFSTDLKLAVGNTHHSLNINGRSDLLQPVTRRTQQSAFGGLLAVASNGGETDDDDLSAITELNTNVSFMLHRNVRVFAGYNLLYWSHVARAGEHISNTVDFRQVPTSGAFNPNVTSVLPARPPIETDGFWAHGINVGIEIGF